MTPTSLSSRPSTKDPAERETEGEWRDPDDVYATMPIQGVLPRLCPRNRIFPSPVLGQVLPPWVHLLDQRYLLFPAPALHLLFTSDSHLDFLVALVIHEAVDLIFLREALDRIVFVLVNALLEKTSDADERVPERLDRMYTQNL